VRTNSTTYAPEVHVRQPHVNYWLVAVIGLTAALVGWAPGCSSTVTPEATRPRRRRRFFRVWGFELGSTPPFDNAVVP
jgi:hypothetical protein